MIIFGCFSADLTADSFLPKLEIFKSFQNFQSIAEILI